MTSASVTGVRGSAGRGMDPPIVCALGAKGEAARKFNSTATFFRNLCCRINDQPMLARFSSTGWVNVYTGANDLDRPSL